jgi:ATP-dependent RNA helicase SUPV3L1/SUV3
LICLLWAIANDTIDKPGLTEVPALSAAGRTSALVDVSFEKQFYALSGFKVLGEKAVRIDILERLADLIRPTTNWKPDSGTQKPEGAFDGRAFYVTPAMMSILGATHDDMLVILKGLGYKEEKRLEADIKPTEEKIEEKTLEKEETASIAPETGEVSESKEPEEPKSILIWRYGGTGNAKKFSGNRPQNKKFSGKKPIHKGKKQPTNQGNKPKPQQREKPADPDSPFAALAALKANLKSGND